MRHEIGALEEGEDDFDRFDKSYGSAITDPWAVLAERRARSPVSDGNVYDFFGMEAANVNPPGRRTYTLLGYDVVNFALRHPKIFSSVNSDPRRVEFRGTSLIDMDDPEHWRYRALIEGAFRRINVDKWKSDLIEPAVGGLIDKFAGRGRAELTREFTLVFPIEVISRMIGLPEEEIPWIHRHVIQLNTADDPISRKSAAAMAARFLEILADRRRHPRDDFVTQLTTATLEATDVAAIKRQLDDDEIVPLMFLLFSAGGDTTARLTGNALVALFDHPDQFAVVKNDRTLLPRALAEVLRWETPVALQYRTLVQAVELGGRQLSAGAHIVLGLGPANRDPARFENPDEFDIFRAPKPTYLSFGAGPHLCIGMALAKAEAEVALAALLDRLPNLRPDPSKSPAVIRGLTVRCPDRLHVLFDPAG